MNNVRLGIVGIGNMGATHAAMIQAGRIAGLELAALCDRNPERMARFAGVPAYGRLADMFAAGGLDAVLIATPHRDHVDMAVASLEAGLHVLVEKPIAIQVADAQRLIRAHAGREGRQVFAAMFNQRTDHFFLRIRDLVQRGELGEIRRVSWTITDWYRTGAYYRSSAWRAKWATEGGGILLNQCPHNLDLFSWIFGQPVRVRAHCGFGRYHDIEVEDDVTAYLEMANGATATFIASTGEAPGTNRLEIAGEHGRLVYEADRITFTRNDVPMGEFSRTATDGFASPPRRDVPIEVTGHGGQHAEILRNFAAAIRAGEPLIAPAEEGLRSVELANAMLLSAWTGSTIDLPLDGARYRRELEARIAASAGRGSATKPSAP